MPPYVLIAAVSGRGSPSTSIPLPEEQRLKRDTVHLVGCAHVVKAALSLRPRQPLRQLEIVCNFLGALTANVNKQAHRNVSGHTQLARASSVAMKRALGWLEQYTDTDPSKTRGDPLILTEGELPRYVSSLQSTCTIPR